MEETVTSLEPLVVWAAVAGAFPSQVECTRPRRGDSSLMRAAALACGYAQVATAAAWFGGGGSGSRSLHLHAN